MPLSGAGGGSAHGAPGEATTAVPRAPESAASHPEAPRLRRPAPPATAPGTVPGPKPRALMRRRRLLGPLLALAPIRPLNALVALIRTA